MRTVKHYCFTDFMSPTENDKMRCAVSELAFSSDMANIRYLEAKNS